MPPVGAGVESARVKIIDVEPEEGSATLASLTKRSGGAVTRVTVGLLVPDDIRIVSQNRLIPPSAVTVP